MGIRQRAWTQYIFPHESVEPSTITYLPTLVDMPDVPLDDRGRFTLPKQLRERFGERYRVVELHDGIKFIPVAEDPLEALRDEFSDVEKTASELRTDARTTAIENAGK